MSGSSGTGIECTGKHCLGNGETRLSLREAGGRGSAYNKKNELHNYIDIQHILRYNVRYVVRLKGDFTTCITIDVITTPVLKVEADMVSGEVDFSAASDPVSPAVQECAPRKCWLPVICN